MASATTLMPSLDLSCPLAWPSTSGTVNDYPLRQGPEETPAAIVRRLYLETLWLPEELIALSSLVPTLRHLPGPIIAQHIPSICLSLDGIEQKYRRYLPDQLVEEPREELAEASGIEARHADTEVEMMRFVWRLKRLKSEEKEQANGEEEGEEDNEEIERREWFDDLERREVQIQALLRLLLITLPPTAKPPSPKKRKRHAPPPASNPEEELDALTDRLCIWHALGSVVEDLHPGMEPERGWVKAWQEDLLSPLFEGTAAAPLVQAFREKLDPTLSPPSSPEPSPPGSPTLVAFPTLPTLPNAAENASRSRSASVSSLTFGNPGYRRSMSVSSAISAGGQSTRSVSVTRTGVNNSKNWAGKEVKMSKRAIGGAKPKPRQASLPPAPAPQPAPRPLKRAESQMLVMSTPVKKPPASRPPPSSADEIMETPQKA